MNNSNQEFDLRVKAGYYQSLITVPYDTKENRKLYNEQENAATKLFFQDAKEYVLSFGVPEKSAQKVVDKAWSDGHSNGYTEVLYYLDELIDLFVD